MVHRVGEKTFRAANETGQQVGRDRIQHEGPHRQQRQELLLLDSAQIPAETEHFHIPEPNRTEGGQIIQVVLSIEIAGSRRPQIRQEDQRQKGHRIERSSLDQEHAHRNNQTRSHRPQVTHFIHRPGQATPGVEQVL